MNSGYLSAQVDRAPDPDVHSTVGYLRIATLAQGLPLPSIERAGER